MKQRTFMLNDYDADRRSFAWAEIGIGDRPSRLKVDDLEGIIGIKLTVGMEAQLEGHYLICRREDEKAEWVWTVQQYLNDGPKAPRRDADVPKTSIGDAW